MPFPFFSLGRLQAAVATVLRVSGLDHSMSRGLINYEIIDVPFHAPNRLNWSERWTVLHLSDLHAEGIPDGCARLLELLRSISADVCVITGDFVDPASDGRSEAVGRLRELIGAISAPMGVFAVVGNHDPPDFASQLESLGITMLDGIVAKLVRGHDHLWIHGLLPQTKDAESTFASGAFNLAIAHSPDVVAEAERRQMDYLLCGHTHGGQVCLPGGFPILTNTSAGRDLARGPWRRGALPGYTSRGIGVCGQSPRLFCRPEVTIHYLLPSSLKTAAIWRHG